VSPKRGESGLSGVLPVDKPSGITSHDVVNIVRKIAGERRVGHAGTLDPMATGLLMVMVGPATRLAPYLTAAEKHYEARIVFGTETDTHDAEGAIVRNADVPGRLSEAAVAAEVLESAIGTIEQVPPAYSAVKLSGRKAYELARSGEQVDLAARSVRLIEAELLQVDTGPPLAWDVSLQVSKGFYVRSFARDMGRSLDTVAHLGALRRTASGKTTVNDAISIEQLETTTDIESLFSDPARAVDLPALEVDDVRAASVSNGRGFQADDDLESSVDGYVAITHCGMLLAIYQRVGDSLSPATVLSGGVLGVGK